MVQCRIPNHLFGDFVAVLEFLTSFKDILNVQNFFPKGVNFELLERAVVEKELAGLCVCSYIPLLTIASCKYWIAQGTRSFYLIMALGF
jgi:hypothetical protein